MYTERQIGDFCKKFNIGDREFHFPKESLLENGYAPPGGYVKDFCIIRKEERWHLFHIDGRPEERCTESGNEISFGHASTRDLRHWIRHRMPLAVGDRPWENEHVWAPYVHEFNGRFYMFYMAKGRSSSSVITYAVSRDLETWEKRLDGPIAQTEGRDPFLRKEDGRHYLYYTGKEGIDLVASDDMVSWNVCPKVICNPERSQAESCSVHQLGDQYVLWYNDYLHTRDASGDFRAVYVVSDNPFVFDPEQLVPFDFSTSLPTRYAPHDWVEKRPIPVSIELLECGKGVWLVAYFRWHIDRFRLFIGSLDWSKTPARIEEIVTEESLQTVLQQTMSDNQQIRRTSG